MLIYKTKLPGCYLLQPVRARDHRGIFVKTVHPGVYGEHGMESGFVEQFYSVSYRGVLRGMHFQVPPFHHAKLVYCLRGRILDAVVDLREGSPTYGRFERFELSGKNGSLLYIPAGMAHGYYVDSPYALVLYNTTRPHSPEHDGGIRWDSAGIPWPSSLPILSERDRAFPSLNDFSSPFRFEGG